MQNVFLGSSTNERVSSTTPDVSRQDATSVVSIHDAGANLHLLHTRLSSVMRRQLPFEHVNREAAALVDKFTTLMHTFSRLCIDEAAYVCLKAITLLHPGEILIID